MRSVYDGFVLHNIHGIETRDRQGGYSLKAVDPSPLPMQPLLLPRLWPLLMTCGRQAPLLQLPLDDLPSPDHLLLVDRRDASAKDRDVWQAGQLAAALELLEECGRLGRLSDDGEEVGNGRDGDEPRVWDEVAGELEDAFADLYV
jgi:hypothetical protein